MATVLGLFAQEPHPLDTRAPIMAGAWWTPSKNPGIHPIIDSRFPFAEAPAAFTRDRESGLFGKVVIDVA